jgi:septal ring factor EnvC (AmiA/AmiB activator)
MKVHHFQALVLGALCLGAAVLAAVTYNHQQQLTALLVAANSAPADPVPAMRRDLDALGSTLAALPPQLKALGEHQHQQDATFATLSKQLDEVSASLKAIEAGPLGPTKTDLAALEQRLGNAEAAIHALEARPAAPTAQPQPAGSAKQAVKAQTPKPPFTLLGVETRGDVRFISALPAGAHALSTVHLLQPGDSLNDWQLKAIRRNQAVFQVPGLGERSLPLP